MDQVQRNPIGGQKTGQDGTAKVTLYVDVVSPFAYIAYWLTRHSPAFSSVQVTYVPVLLGGLMKATGNRPPMVVKHKDTWIDRERIRWSRNFQIPMMDGSPKPFPQSTMAPQRALCHIAANMPAESLVQALDALYHAFWVEGKSPIGDLEVLVPVLEGALGREKTAEVMAATKNEAAKKALQANTDAAFRDEAFGLPWFVATNAKGEKEGFWGVDHIGQLLQFLGVETKGERGYKALL